MSDEFKELGYARELPTVSKGKEHGKRAAGVKAFWGNQEAFEARMERYRTKGYPGLNNLKPEKNCQYCGTPLAFGMTNDGKRIPLDLKAPVYAVIYEKSDSHAGNVICRTTICYVNHWSTCPEWKKAKEDQDKKAMG